MPTPNDPLWKRIESFDFDDGAQPATLPFVLRLARDNRWTIRFAQRAIDEYRRFVYMAATADEHVTPSDEVDQVWHLHMTYTRSYWDRLCSQVLGKPLHHEPTRGGTAEREKFHLQYERTLERYEQVFGERPPRDLWPASRQRFALAMQQRLDAGRCVVMPGWALGFRGGAIRVLLTIVGVGAMANHFFGDQAEMPQMPLHWAFVTLFACLGGVVVLSLPRLQGQTYRRQLRRDASAGGVGGYVAGGGATEDGKADLGCSDGGGDGCGGGCGGCGGCG